MKPSTKTESQLSANPTLLRSSATIQHFKQLILENNRALIDRFNQSTPVLELISERANFIDRLLAQCWKGFLGAAGDRLALVATGGYGRRELHPHSDIDLLVLLDDAGPEPYRAALEIFFTFLWDIGLKPGQSVQTVAECAELARGDQTVTTTLMDSRLVEGSEQLFADMKARTGPDRIWPSSAFFVAKMEEQEQRYAKYHDTAYNLEPNLKEGPGGLRDIQVIGWVIKRHYNARTLYELVKQECLTESEYVELMSAQKFLWKVRFALHALTGRGEDRLLFDHQEAVARHFGFEDSDQSRAVEQFMQHYYRTVMALQRLNDMLMQLFREVMLREHEDCQTVSINLRFQSLCGFIEVTHDNVFKEHPLGLLEIFLLLQQIPSLKGIRAATIRLIRQSLDLIDDRFRSDQRASALFMEILRQRSGITHQLRWMNRYGVLAAYLPDFAHIVGRMQYDLFHVYTVDEHTLILIRNLRRFALHRHNDELPFCNTVFLLIPKPELLYVAALFHDIAKGKGGDHSVLGEQISEAFCRQHNLNEHDTRLIQWLVRHHLIMSMTAQRKDISNPEVIHEFASTVGSLERLNYLYLLTVADIRATNPAMWNNWKDTLLRDLYIGTHRALHCGLENPLDQQDKIESSQREARMLLHRLGLNDNAIDAVWDTFSDEYFLRYSPDECAWHTIAIDSSQVNELPLVLVRPQNQRGCAELFLYAKDEDHLFSHSTAVLDQLGLTIVDARIITSNDGYVLNSYLVLEQSGESIKDLYREQQICTKVRAGLLDPSAASPSFRRREGRQAIHFPIKTRVTYHPGVQNRYTVLELIAIDRPGLLSKVGQAFKQLHIRLHNAKVTTIGARAEDMFYITDQQDQPLECPQLRDRLRQAIIQAVGKE
jgi:[protein-PII] uridylyltransferase